MPSNSDSSGDFEGTIEEKLSSSLRHEGSFVGNNKTPTPSEAAYLGEVYACHSRSLLRYFGRQVGADAAPDLLHDVFARAAGSTQLGSLMNPGGFLRKIAKNLLIDRARKSSREPQQIFSFEDGFDAATLPEQELRLEAEDLLRLYEQAVDEMPEKTRRVFLLHRVDELSYKEIHELLGISLSTVEYHMMKALAHISHLRDDYE